MKNFFEVKILHDEAEQQADIIIARLADLGFDGFVEEEKSVLAYREAPEADRASILQTLFEAGFSDVQINTITDRNWNAEWESEYPSVCIDNKIVVRAPFHDARPDVKYDLIIEPRMSFGTAHHETTSQMLSMLSELDVRGKNVLDMGCGTAVLAILAEKMGAASILAIDNDEWAYNNALDNIRMNDAMSIEVLLGDANTLGKRHFHIIIANINRNILLEDISSYAEVLEPGGMLLMSGFYESDLSHIQMESEKAGLKLQASRSENKWMAAAFINK
jgi:ribosomal protein L11 methyltransferase